MIFFIFRLEQFIAIDDNNNRSHILLILLILCIQSLWLILEYDSFRSVSLSANREETKKIKLKFHCNHKQCLHWDFSMSCFIQNLRFATFGAKYARLDVTNFVQLSAFRNFTSCHKNKMLFNKSQCTEKNRTLCILCLKWNVKRFENFFFSPLFNCSLEFTTQ